MITPQVSEYSVFDRTSEGEVDDFVLLRDDDVEIVASFRAIGRLRCDNSQLHNSIVIVLLALDFVRHREVESFF